MDAEIVRVSLLALLDGLVWPEKLIFARLIPIILLTKDPLLIYKIILESI
jgi:hypothetical protein